MRKASFIADSTIRLSQTLRRPANWSGRIYGDTARNDSPPVNGFSWFVIEKGAPPGNLAYKVVFHRGEQAGFSAEFAMIPERNVLILIESNGIALEKGYPSFGYLYWTEVF